MDGDRRLSLTVGGFALLGILALGLAILSLSSKQGFFQARYHLVAYFDNRWVPHCLHFHAMVNRGDCHFMLVEDVGIFKR